METTASLAAAILQKWKTWSEIYRQTPKLYQEALNKKREAKIPLRKLSAQCIKEYPKISFFDIEDENTAMSVLSTMKKADLVILLNKINNAIDFNYTFTTMRSFIQDAEYQLHFHEFQKINRNRILPESYHNPLTSKKFSGGSYQED